MNSYTGYTGDSRGVFWTSVIFLIFSPLSLSLFLIIQSKHCRVALKVSAKFSMNSPYCPIGSCSNLLQIAVPLRDLPDGPVYLLPVEPRPRLGRHGWLSILYRSIDRCCCCCCWVRTGGYRSARVRSLSEVQKLPSFSCEEN